MGLISSILGNASETDSQSLQENYERLLAENETIEAGFNIFRDTFIFTDRRLILVNVQGFTGKKIEYFSIPYGKITRFSVETAGHFDLDAELKIWICNSPNPISKKFNRSVDIYSLQAILAKYTS